MVPHLGFLGPLVSRSSLASGKNFWGYGQGVAPRHVPCGSDSGEWGRSAVSPVTYLFFRLVWTVPSPVKSAGVCRGGIEAGRIIRWEELGDGVGLMGTESG